MAEENTRAAALSGGSPPGGPSPDAADELWAALENLAQRIGCAHCTAAGYCEYCDAAYQRMDRAIRGAAPPSTKEET